MPSTSTSETAAAPEPVTNPPDDPSDGDEPADDGGCGAGMALVSGGTLWMGSPEGQGKPDEHPRFAKEVKAFCLDVAEVSVADFQACVKNDICDALPDSVEGLKLKPAQQEKKSALCSARLGDADLPLSCVTQEAAVKLCRWKGRRLPTEPELEWAATGGADKLPYPWGTSQPDDNKLCWKKDAPCKVRSRPPGAFGIHDLAGNLAEWTSTRYGAYPGPVLKADKIVVRGSSFRATKPDEVVAQRRGARDLATADVDLGFRCAKDR